MALTSINADGWSANYGTPPTFDPVGSPETFTVQRAGFDSTGGAVTVNDTVTLMKRLRQPYPNESTLTVDQVALSDFIYSGEVISGVANNSTRAAPKPLAMWLTRDLCRAETSTFSARLAVIHAHGRNGRPVAAVKFIASDGTNSVEQTVSTMSSRQWPASGLHGAYFECSLDISTLNQGALCTLDAIIYPWVGAAFQLSVDADTYPSVNLTVLKFLCDRTGAYGTAYAYVDGVGGGTPTVSTTAATAEANPYATVAAAAAAIQTYNSANFGRNSASGGVVRLKVGTHPRTGFASVAVTEIPLVIEADDIANKASVIFTDNATSGTNSIPDKTVWRNMTFRKLGASITFLDSNATLSNLDYICALENVDIDQNGQSAYDAWIYRLGRIFLDGVTGGWANIFNTFSTTNKHIHMVGCSGSWNATGLYMSFASRLEAARVQMLGSQPNGQAQVGPFHAFGHFTNKAQQEIVKFTPAIDARGAGLAMLVLEQTAGLTGPALSLSADNILNAAANIVRVGLTVVGSRSNVLYQDTGSTTIAKSAYEIGCVHRGRNTKSDLFPTADGNRIGNWPEVFQVAHRHNAIVMGGQDNQSPGVTGAWVGEVAALGGQYGTTGTPIVVDWVDDRSFDGAGTGGGDYTPDAGSALGTLPGGYVHYPIDMLGRAIPVNGTAKIGAIQPAGTGIDAVGASQIVLGQSAAGVLRVEAAGQGQIVLGQSAAGVVSGANIDAVGASQIVLGQVATGVLQVEAAGQGQIVLGQSAAGVVSGANIDAVGASQIALGQSAAGVLRVEATGQGQIVLGQSAAGVVSGAGIDAVGASQIVLGQAATGVLRVEAAGQGQIVLGQSAVGVIGNLVSARRVATSENSRNGGILSRG